MYHPSTRHRHQSYRNEFLIEMVDPVTGKKKRRKRLIDKSGQVNIVHTYTTAQNFRFLCDIFTTLVDIKWRYNLTIFTLVYLIGWIIFATIWWLIALQHGDLVPENINNPDRQACVSNVFSFPTAFLFSIETQTTIGYGYRSITDECWIAVFLMVIQSVFSCVIDAVMIGCVFAKIAKPKRRAQTLVFSKNAVIIERDGRLVLLMQLADMRRSNLFEAHIRAKFVKHRLTKEGERIPLYQQELNVGYEYGVDRIFLVWPLILEHPIDSKSPFYNMSAEDLKHADFEVIVILEGIVASTGMTTQKRTSYLPDEILWGHRFDDRIIGLSGNCYEVNYSFLHTTVQQRTPLCSMKDLDQMRKPPEIEINQNDISSTRKRTISADSELHQAPAPELLEAPESNNLNKDDTNNTNDVFEVEIVENREKTD